MVINDSSVVWYKNARQAPVEFSFYVQVKYKDSANKSSAPHIS